MTCINHHPLEFLSGFFHLVSSEESLVDQFVNLKGPLGISKFLIEAESNASVFISLCLVLVNVVVSHTPARNALAQHLVPCLSRWLLEHDFDISVFALLMLLLRSGRASVAPKQAQELIKSFILSSQHPIDEHVQDIWELAQDGNIVNLALVDCVTQLDLAGLPFQRPHQPNFNLEPLLNALKI